MDENQNLQEMIPETAEQAEAVISALGEPDGGTEIHTKDVEAQAPAKYKINYKGREEEYALDKILSFAQQGRDYAQRLGEFNKQKSEWEKTYTGEKTKWEGLEKKLSRYDEIENYLKTDPEWWGHVNDSYEKRLAERQGQSPAQLPPEVAQKISELDQFVTSQKEREVAAEREKADQALDLEISEYRKKYADLNWEELDDSGLSLEKRILKHAADMGLTKPEHFRIAANDMLFDEHIKRAGHTAKENVGRHLEKVSKLGLGPVTEKRTLGVRQVKNVAAKSWDEITQEAIEAAGLNS